MYWLTAMQFCRNFYPRTGTRPHSHPQLLCSPPLPPPVKKEGDALSKKAKKAKKDLQKAKRAKKAASAKDAGEAPTRSAFTKPQRLSAALSAVVGGVTALGRPQCTKQVREWVGE